MFSNYFKQDPNGGIKLDIICWFANNDTKEKECLLTSLLVTSTDITSNYSLMCTEFLNNGVFITICLDDNTHKIFSNVGETYNSVDKSLPKPALVYHLPSVYYNHGMYNKMLDNCKMGYPNFISEKEFIKRLNNIPHYSFRGGMLTDISLHIPTGKEKVKSIYNESSSIPWTTDKVNDSPKPKEKSNDNSINIFLSCGENATYDDDPDRRRSIHCTRITNLILANKNLSHLKPAPFNIISNERDFNDDDIEWYDKTIAKFTANIENIDVLCLVLPYLEKPIDALDYSLMVLASDHKIPIHIITSNKDVNETIGMEDYIDQIATTYPNHVHKMYRRFVQKHSNLIIHPNEFDFIMGIAKKNK